MFLLGLLVRAVGLAAPVWQCMSCDAFVGDLAAAKDLFFFRFIFLSSTISRASCTAAADLSISGMHGNLPLGGLVAVTGFLVFLVAISAFPAVLIRAKVPAWHGLPLTAIVAASAAC